MPSRNQYKGSRRKLVIGIDVGTTFSGVSYSILDPGVVPVIQGVNRFPAQQRVGGDAKIPSIIYYDSSGAVRAVGAEALLGANLERAEEEHWVKAEWFKLYLRPKKLLSDEYIPPLPLSKTAEQVFGDFLKYLYQCTRQYIEDTHAGGPQLWESLAGHADFVLAHPNGWEGAQQAQMRCAAIDAGLIPGTPEGHSRIKFVTEGEASLHYCVSNNFASNLFKKGEGVIIVDAGGGTIDMSAFHKKESTEEFEEIAPARCLFQGSVYVSRRARALFQHKLYASRYGSPDDIDYITDCFDKSTKLTFSNTNQVCHVKFGSVRDTDASVDIKFGQLKLKGSDVASLFMPSLSAIQQAINEQKTGAHVRVTSVLLVGGFAASNWLFSNLHTYLQENELRLYRPDGHLGKVVANGAVSFLVDHFVSMRVAKMTFGIEKRKVFDSEDSEHRRRSNSVVVGPDGYQRLPKYYDVILAKGSRVSETTVFSQSYSRYRSNKADLRTVSVVLVIYRGNKAKPQWMDVEPHMFSSSCTVTANIRSDDAIQLVKGIDGESCYRFDFEIELLFGLTEHKAQICWDQAGVKRRGPATIVYD